MPAGRKRGRYSQVVRVLKLIEYLSARRSGVSLADIAEAFEVSERQVRRDLDVIVEAGHTLRNKAQGDGIRLVSGRDQAIRLSIRERYTLLAVRRVFDVLEGTPFREDVASIYDKITASLPEVHQQDIAAFGERFAYVPDGGTKIYARKADVLDALLTGVIQRCRVRCRYRPRDGGVRKGELEPYALVLYKHGLYVIGRPIAHPGEVASGVRMYAAERFTRAEHIRGARFEVPADFAVDRFFEGAFGIHVGSEPQQVTIEFARRAARLVSARIWHPSQKLTVLARGRVRLDFEAADQTQIVPWVLGWGPLARVVAPDALRQQVQREHRRALRAYSL